MSAFSLDFRVWGGPQAAGIIVGIVVVCFGVFLLNRNIPRKDVASVTDCPIPLVTLENYIWSHFGIRVFTALYVLAIWSVGKFYIENSAPDLNGGYPDALLVVFCCLFVSSFILLVQCWGWGFQKGDGLSFRIKNAGFHIDRYPWHPLLVDIIALMVLVASTGGISSIFVPLYPMISLSGDVVLRDSRFLKFTGFVALTFLFGCLLSYFDVVNYEVVYVIGHDDQGATIKRGWVLGIGLGCQVLVMGAIGFLLNKSVLPPKEKEE